MTREQFKELSGQMAEKLSGDMVDAMMKVYDAFTADEVAKLDTVDKPFFLVRAVGMAVGADVISQRYDVEAIKGLTPRVKRIMKKRNV